VNNQISITALKRCLSEKKRQELAVRACDYCSESYKKHRKCYHSVSNEIKRGMHNCLIA
jgi:hypothetical protein